MAAQPRRRGRAVEEILRLRRAERRAGIELRNELRSVREFLETEAGPTIPRAEAARVLGVSQTALDRWISRNEVSAVITPRGRREIPLSELIELLEEVEDLRDGGSLRPLASVIRNRNARSSQEIDIDRLLPRRRSRRSHRVPELQALAYHRLVAERLNDQVVDEARRRLRRWDEEGRIHRRWAEEWKRVLSKPIPGIAKAIGADTKHARELRQTSPFAGVLTEQERRRLLRDVEQRALT